MHYQYLDENGQPVLTVSTSTPSIVVVPENRQIEEAVPMHSKALNAHLKKVEKDAQGKPAVDALTKQVQELHTKVEQLLKDKK